MSSTKSSEHCTCHEGAGENQACKQEGSTPHQAPSAESFVQAVSVRNPSAAGGAPSLKPWCLGWAGGHRAAVGCEC